MPKYQYRALDVGYGGESPDYPKKPVRKDSKNALRWYRVTDSGRSELLWLTDEVGDDYDAFKKRANAAFVDYLNAPGNEGWKLVSYTREETGGDTRLSPVGAYLFMREAE